MSDSRYDDLASEDYGRLARRNTRIRFVAWLVVGALILGGGGATVLVALFG